MSEEQKKNNDEEKTIPKPEGYTIVKYAEGWVDLIVLVLGLVILTFLISVFKDVFIGRIWLFLLIDFGVLALLWVIGRKITEVKVNLKITDMGLEQTRLSGSKLYPEHRLIKWKDMTRYHLYGRGRGNEFYIVVKGDTNFRISTPLFSLFQRHKENKENFAAFQDDFLGMASQHNVHRAFFG